MYYEYIASPYGLMLKVAADDLFTRTFEPDLTSEDDQLQLLDHNREQQ
jgi:hypothetical protein